MTPSLSVIICTYNRYDFLPKAIQSIAAQEIADGSLELIVVDNSSNHLDQRSLIAGAMTHWPFTYVVESKMGLSRARNIGVAKASADVVAFLDDDAIAASGWAADILRRFHADPKIGVLGGPVRPIWSTAYPKWLDPALQGYFTVLDLGQEHRPIRPHEFLAGANVAFKRAPLIAAGGFSEHLGRIGKVLLSNEEIELSSRIAASGYSISYSPGMIVDHYIHEDRIAQSWLRQRVFWQVVSEIISTPGELTTNKSESIRQVRAFMQAMPARYRNASSLFIDVSAPELFSRQLSAIAAYTRLMAIHASDWGDASETP